MSATPSATMTDSPAQDQQQPQQTQRFGSYLTENFTKDPAPPHYLCGSCGVTNRLTSGERVSCKSCGYKILYKARQREVRQFYAR